MNTSIAALKRSKSNLDTLIGELNKVAEPQSQKQSYSDDRFWKPELDKSGNGYAVFRFLPAVKNEDLPYEDRDHALFVAFAPYEDPRYAISVVIEHGGSGSKAAAPIAKKVIKKVLDRHPLRETKRENGELA